MRPDEQLMLDVQRGSREALVELFERYRGPIWRFFRRRVHDVARAEELSQDTFVGLLESARRYRSQGSFRSYLFGIAFNILLAEERKARHRRTAPLADEAMAPPGPDRNLELWVRAALARLEPEDREILILREYDDLSYQEIADLRRLPINTVRSRLFRARMALKDVLNAEVRTINRTSHAAR